MSLPISDLAKSIAFYRAIGFTQKMLFPDNSGTWMDLSDTFSVMLMTHAKWKEFTRRIIPDAKKTAQFGLSITKENKNEVDTMLENGTKGGGRSDPNPVEDHGFIYGRSIEDPDWHILEFKWMDMQAMQ
ncbi:MAG: hypothetical protein JNM39_15185 [Bdellovibrionaceae bacterium]|nr:hypothetical protein [Pseudobdellovibrionaceae bacterium]